MSSALIGLGSNLPDRAAHLRAAIDSLRRLPETTLLRASSTYDSRAQGAEGDPDFLNAAVLVETGLSPRLLLWHLLLIESRLGRERHRRFGPRSIDLDLLFYDDRCIEEADLTVPHPRMLDRPFVLAPLAEIAPEFRHPVEGRALAELSRAGSAGVRMAGRL